MSEHPEYNSGMSHALWHTFEPSPALSEYVQQLLREDAEAHFQFRSTKEVHVDSVAYRGHEYQEELTAIRASNESAKQPFRIARVAAKLMRFRSITESGEIQHHETLRIAAQPKYQERFNALIQVLDELPDSRGQAVPQPTSHYLVADFHESQLKADGILNGELRSFREDALEHITKGLFNATLIGLGGAEKAGPRGNAEPDWLVSA